MLPVCASCRDKELSAREALLREQQADVAKAEEAALAERQRLLAQVGSFPGLATTHVVAQSPRSGLHGMCPEMPYPLHWFALLCLMCCRARRLSAARRRWASSGRRWRRSRSR